MRKNIYVNSFIIQLLTPNKNLLLLYLLLLAVKLAVRDILILGKMNEINDTYLLSVKDMFF